MGTDSRTGDDGAPRDQPRFTPYSEVRVIRLVKDDRWWTAGMDEIARAPAVGDRGTIVDDMVDGEPDRYHVEAADADGNTIWIAEFWDAELEVVENK